MTETEEAVMGQVTDEIRAVLHGQTMTPAQVYRKCPSADSLRTVAKAMHNMHAREALSREETGLPGRGESFRYWLAGDAASDAGNGAPAEQPLPEGPPAAPAPREATPARGISRRIVEAVMLAGGSATLAQLRAVLPDVGRHTVSDNINACCQRGLLVRRGKGMYGLPPPGSPTGRKAIQAAKQQRMAPQEHRPARRRRYALANDGALFLQIDKQHMQLEPEDTAELWGYLGDVAHLIPHRGGES